MQQRQCVVLEGDLEWCQSASKNLLANFSKNTIISLSANADNDFLTISQKQAQQYLGKEFDAVIFDALTQFNPDSLAAIIGTIRQGGVLVIWLDSSQNSLWLQRFNRITNQWGQTRLILGDKIERIEEPTKSIESDPIDLNGNQKQAVEAIKKVVHGHRRRPLVLSADRGRGKSASLGIAAAQLLAQGKQTILVTAPSLAIADTVFEHARRLLIEAHCSAGLILLDTAEIRFIAPDALIKSDLKADLVLVDEAAAIPVSMLQKILKKYSRLVFSTTLHGYEGTGQGFSVRFQQILDQQTPDWHHYQMTTPIRWVENDQLEAFSFEALLLNAEPVVHKLIEKAQVDLCNFEKITQKQLLNDEQSLRELFGLMVLAHYRTRPSDLQMLLDHADISIYIARYQGHIIASAWLVNEGELDNDLAQAIHAGERRLKGHLLPQSLLAHAGISCAGSLAYQRIIRIAVHPSIQQRNIGSYLLNYIVEQSTLSGTDIVGTSFGSEVGLLDFWSKSSFVPARLGIHKDDVSGCHSVMMLRSVSELGANVLNDAVTRFQQQCLSMWHGHFKDLTPALLIAILQKLPPQNNVLLEWDINDIRAFALAQRGFDFSVLSLQLWLQNIIASNEFMRLRPQQQQLCVMAVLQQRDWSEIAEDLDFSGKSQAIKALREVCAPLVNTLPDGK